MAVNDIFMLPKQKLTMTELSDVLQAEQSEIDLLKQLIKAIENQLFINTSTDFIEKYEKQFLIPPNSELTLEERRTKVIAKLNTRVSATVSSISKLISITTGKTADITEHFKDCTFDVIVPFELNENTKVLQEMIKQLDDIKPAHLALSVAALIEIISYLNENNLLVKSLCILGNINNFGEESIFLNGRKNLDGTWMLRQIYSKGMNIFSLMLNLNQQNRLSVSGAITADTMYRLDGMYLVNGSKKLNAEIKRSEL